MRILALDVGTKTAGSGVVLFDTSVTAQDLVRSSNTTIVACGIWPNTVIENRFVSLAIVDPLTVLVFEGVSHHGNKAGRDVHRANLWIGRLFGVWRTTLRRHLGAPEPVVILARTAAAWMGASRRTKKDPTIDSQVAQAVRDRFGGMGASRKDVCGTKNAPGPLYGFRGDVYRAMAVGIAYVEGAEQEEPWE